MVVISDLSEETAGDIIQKFNLNPLLQLEIMLKQIYDKAMHLENAVFFSIQIIKEYQLNRQIPFKVIHLFTKNLLFVISHSDGHQYFIRMMKELFRFRKCKQDELCLLRRKSSCFGRPFGSLVEQNQQESDESEDAEFWNSEGESESSLNKSVNKSVHKRQIDSISKGVITCEDVLFGLFDESLRKIEPIVQKFETEAQILNTLSMNLSHYEQLDFVRRSHMAKQMQMQFQMDVEIKEDFFRQVQAVPLSYPKLKTLILFLQGRLNNTKVIMRKSKQLISLSQQTYDHIVDNGLNEYQFRLNKIMKALTAITVAFLPFQIMGGLFGMNVRVPMQVHESYIPFSILCSISAFISLSLIVFFKFFQWL